MGFIIGLVIFGIPSAIIAGVKGFKPFRWLIAFGFIGLIVVGSMASATKKGISEDDAQIRADKADKVGAIMAWLNIGLSIILILVILGQS